MEFAVYSYVDLDHYQYVGLMCRGFSTIESAIAYKEEFEAGDWASSLIGTIFVSLYIEDETINVCTEHFDRRWIYEDGKEPVLRDMDAEYKQLLSKYF